MEIGYNLFLITDPIGRLYVDSLYILKIKRRNMDI
jgi:hypothetical protein